tara:strand:+ start:1796 stop:1906 length:111 start_codon:yes stop_codon:yes gene_type:complete
MLEKDIWHDRTRPTKADVKEAVKKEELNVKTEKNKL